MLRPRKRGFVPPSPKPSLKAHRQTRMPRHLRVTPAAAVAAPLAAVAVAVAAVAAPLAAAAAVAVASVLE